MAAMVASMAADFAHSIVLPKPPSTSFGLHATSSMAPWQPAFFAFSTFPGMHRQNAKISGPRFRSTMAFIASSSCHDTAGMPASMRSTPSAASFLAMAILSSMVKTTPCLLALAQRHVMNFDFRIKS